MGTKPDILRAVSTKVANPGAELSGKARWMSFLMSMSGMMVLKAEL